MHWTPWAWTASLAGILYHLAITSALFAVLLLTVRKWHWNISSGRGYEYDVIVLFLCKFHGIEMSVRTLKSRFSSLGLRRKDAELNEGEVRQRMQQEVDRPGCLSGYRSMWHTLRREGYAIPRHLVHRLLKEMDPDGCEMRRRHRLQRRAYVNLGPPNYCWHIDGYDKLKPYGFPIHAIIIALVEGCKVEWQPCGCGKIILGNGNRKWRVSYQSQVWLWNWKWVTSRYTVLLHEWLGESYLWHIS